FWQHISEVRNVYPYLANLAFANGKAAFKRNIADRKMHVPVIVEKEGEDGESYLEDNPLLHVRGYFEHRRDLPAFIQGVDLQICNYIREDHDYGRIAEILSMTEAAVERR